MKILFALIALCSAGLLRAESSAQNPFLPVETMTFASQVLDEDRTILLTHPEGYARDGSLPIVVVTDAMSQFPFVSAFIQNQSRDWGRLPPMVIAGIVNTNRNRDFLPREDPNFEAGGGGDQFARFLREELMPRLETEMGGARSKILVGHSFGGVNAINILLTDEDLFDAYIAIGTSTWVSERVLFERARERFANGRPLDSWLYMAVAERDGGATVPDGKLFAELFEQSAPDTLDWHFEVIPETDHFSAVPIGVNRAFLRLFPVWDQKDAILESAHAGPDAIAGWFESRERALGWRFWPNSLDTVDIVYALLGEKKYAEALKVLEYAQQYHPSQAELWILEGDVLNSDGRNDEAIAVWREALAMLEAMGAQAPRTAFVRRRLGLTGSTED